jgi:hypothetical protein
MKDIFTKHLGITSPFDAVGSVASIVELDQGHKVDVLITLLNISHTNVVSWTSRAYQAVTWAMGAHFAAVSFLFGRSPIAFLGLDISAFGLLVFALFVQLYLRTAIRAHRGNRATISKCEAALGLYDPGKYFVECGFFEYSPAMLQSRSLQILRFIHFIAVGLSIIALSVRNHFQ